MSYFSQVNLSANGATQAATIRQVQGTGRGIIESWKVQHGIDAVCRVLCPLQMLCHPANRKKTLTLINLIRVRSAARIWDSEPDSFRGFFRAVTRSARSGGGCDFLASTLTLTGSLAVCHRLCHRRPPLHAAKTQVCSHGLTLPQMQLMQVHGAFLR
jgi:hypothetical protein